MLLNLNKYKASCSFPRSVYTKAIDANTIKEVCTKYIYNKAPAIAAVGTYHLVLYNTNSLYWCAPLPFL